MAQLSICWAVGRWMTYGPAIVKEEEEWFVHVKDPPDRCQWVGAEGRSLYIFLTQWRSPEMLPVTARTA